MEILQIEEEEEVLNSGLAPPLTTPSSVSRVGSARSEGWDHGQVTGASNIGRATHFPGANPRGLCCNSPKPRQTSGRFSSHTSPGQGEKHGEAGWFIHHSSSRGSTNSESLARSRRSSLASNLSVAERLDLLDMGTIAPDEISSAAWRVRCQEVALTRHGSMKSTDKVRE
eukprot:scaffold517_cov255-Pinguiococcus_pyrenoidosus.AAC.7